MDYRIIIFLFVGSRNRKRKGTRRKRRNEILLSCGRERNPILQKCPQIVSTSSEGKKAISVLRFFSNYLLRLDFLDKHFFHLLYSTLGSSCSRACRAELLRSWVQILADVGLFSPLIYPIQFTLFSFMLRTHPQRLRQDISCRLRGPNSISRATLIQVPHSDTTLLIFL